MFFNSPAECNKQQGLDFLFVLMGNMLLSLFLLILVTEADAAVSCDQVPC